MKSNIVKINKSFRKYFNSHMDNINEKLSYIALNPIKYERVYRNCKEIKCYLYQLSILCNSKYIHSRVFVETIDKIKTPMGYLIADADMLADNDRSLKFTIDAINEIFVFIRKIENYYYCMWNNPNFEIRKESKKKRSGHKDKNLRIRFSNDVNKVVSKEVK